jgi:NADPH-dependent glutamate synthase beta subunit-like oxidoreductase/coenzyme F420-reducing hydrogenase delta subunit/NAD-dependent dihydropyrimidine dehydrogenase PreA subunit
MQLTPETSAPAREGGSGRQPADRSLVPPCKVGCPLHQDIREYVDLVAQGRILEALQVIRDGNPFPSICAYVCGHPCEDSCRRTQVDKPVAIRALKRFAVEFGSDRLIEVDAKTTHPERVAIVGSGPAGMSCAYYLRKLGYAATVFEAYSEVGGMLRSGVPQYRLPREVLDREFERLTRMGVEIRTNTPVVSLDLVFELGYKAIFVTVGAQQSRRLGVPGEDQPGVIDAITFLREVSLGLRPALGERVVVIGGGNVAIDAARTALRLGAKKATLVCLESRPEMPAFREDVEAAEDEGVVINCSWGPKAFVGDGQLAGLDLIRCASVFDDQQRFCPTYDETIVSQLACDTAITAIGQMPKVPDDFGLRKGRGSTIQVDPVTLTTNRVGVFAGGDAVTGPATAIKALAAGRQAAGRIDDYLQHRYPRDLDLGPALEGDLEPRTIEVIKSIGRNEPRLLPPAERLEGFQPVESVLDWDSAVAEARRCLRCGMGAEVLSQDKCASCLTCVRVCPYHVPRVDQTGTVVIPPEQCQACGVCVGECPARAIALRKPYDRRQVEEELQHALNAAPEAKARPLILGFCCQYGLFGTHALAGVWRRAKGGVWIVPVLCAAKVEAEHILRAFELGSEGVFVAGCGEQCARENTDLWLRQRVERVRKTLSQLGLEPERLQAFVLAGDAENLVHELDRFVERVGGLYVSRAIRREVGS